MEGQVYVTAHAADRWRERVNPKADRTVATVTIVGVWRGGQRVEGRMPKWLRQTRKDSPLIHIVLNDEWPDVALVVSPEPDAAGVWHVLTVLDRYTARSVRSRVDLAGDLGANGVSGKRKAGRMVRRRRLEQEEADGWEGSDGWRR